MEANMIQVYMTPFGTVRLADLPRDVSRKLAEAPKRKDGGFDLRTKAGKEAARCARQIEIMLQERWEAGT